VGKARLLTLDAQVSALTEDRGGKDQVSVAEQALIMRAAILGAIVSDFEARWVAGEPIPLPEYLSAVNVQRRVLATLGLKREQRTISWRDQWLSEAAAGDATDATENVAGASDPMGSVKRAPTINLIQVRRVLTMRRQNEQSAAWTLFAVSRSVDPAPPAHRPSVDRQ
jgi:hypothetical protein